MSGPKRGTWNIPYDPTPARLDDLESFTEKQDQWLHRHGRLIERYLGKEALFEALEARRQVEACIEAGDPDEGFDAYGRAWGVFNGLYRRAQDERRHQEYQQRQRRQQAAERLADDCKALWRDVEDQALLRRWINKGVLANLRASLESVAGGGLKNVRTKARQWRSEFIRTLDTARKMAGQNRKAVQAQIPRLKKAVETLDTIDANLLPDREEFQREKNRLRQAADQALTDEEQGVLVESIRLLRELATVYERKVKIARFEKAAGTVRAALASCGYAVMCRREADGTVVLQASSFPFKSVNVQMSPETREMKLNVKDERGAHCVDDIGSLQAELARQGMDLKMTDWGKGKPRSVHQHHEQNLRIGGNR